MHALKEAGINFAFAMRGLGTSFRLRDVGSEGRPRSLATACLRFLLVGEQRGKEAFVRERSADGLERLVA